VTLPPYLHPGAPAQPKTYQWLCSGAPIAGATLATYEIQATDDECILSAQVTVKANFYKTLVDESPASNEVEIP
jgi:hypothetical protein